MKVFLIFACLAFLNQAYANTKICKISSEVSLKYNDGMDPSHELTLSGKTILIGGRGEKFPKNIDHLAVQRGLINCAQPILECFAKSEKFMPKEFVVAFNLNPVGETATASNFKFIWKNSRPLKIEKCLTKIWSAVQFGLIIQDAVDIRMPVKLN